MVRDIGVIVVELEYVSFVVEEEREVIRLLNVL